MKTRRSTRTAKAEAPAGSAPDEGPTAAHPLLSALLHCGVDGIDRDQATICRLLCTSKAAAAAVAESCSGQLTVDLDPPSASRASSTELAARCSSQAAWLRTNGHLLRELRCLYFSSQGFPPKPALLELLPALTSSTPNLAKLVGRVDMSTFSSAAAARATASTLASLTSLTSLRLAIDSAQSRGGPAPFFAAMQQLPHLMDCHLGLVGSGPGFMAPDAAGLQQLPTQLTSLGLGLRLGLHQDGLEHFIDEAGVGELQAMLSDAEFGDMLAGGPQGIDTSNMFGPLYPKRVAPMLLGHLTALKELRPIEDGLPAAWHWGAQLDIRAGDVLPPNLTYLELHSDRRDLCGLLVGPLAAPTVSPILPLKQLQVLTIHDSAASATQLQQLSAALTSLRSASLSYASLQAAAAAAAAWPSLPLVALTVTNESSSRLYNDDSEEENDEGVLPDPVGAVLDAAGQLTKLTQLVMAGGHWDATQQQLAAVLEGLTDLQELRLSGSIKPDEPLPQSQQPVEQRGKKAASAAAAADDAAPATTTAAAAAAGAAASPAGGLSAVIAALPSLRHLSIQSDTHRYSYMASSADRAPLSVDVAAALAAGSNAQQLTFLQLSGLDDAAVELLAGRLTGLRVWDLGACRDVTTACLPALESLAGAGVLKEVRWVGSGLKQEAAVAAGLSQRLEAVSAWERRW